MEHPRPVCNDKGNGAGTGSPRDTVRAGNPDPGYGQHEPPGRRRIKGLCDEFLWLKQRRRETDEIFPAVFDGLHGKPVAINRSQDEGAELRVEHGRILVFAPGFQRIKNFWIRTDIESHEMGGSTLGRDVMNNEMVFHRRATGGGP